MGNFKSQPSIGMWTRTSTHHKKQARVGSTPEIFVGFNIAPGTELQVGEYMASSKTNKHFWQGNLMLTFITCFHFSTVRKYPLISNLNLLDCTVNPSPSVSSFSKALCPDSYLSANKDCRHPPSSTHAAEICQ